MDKRSSGFAAFGLPGFRWVVFFLVTLLVPFFVCLADVFFLAAAFALGLFGPLEAFFVGALGLADVFFETFFDSHDRAAVLKGLEGALFCLSIPGLLIIVRDNVK